VMLRDMGILDREHEIKERDMYIDHLEARFKELEEQILKKDLMLKEAQQNVNPKSKKNSSSFIAGFGQKKKRNDNLSDDISNGDLKKNKNSFVFNNGQNQSANVELPSKYIRVKSDMENYREKATLPRTPSCPLLITDQSSDRFKIYDKVYLVHHK